MLNIKMGYLVCIGFMLLGVLSHVQGTIKNYPEGTTCINGTYEPAKLIFVHYNITAIPGQTVDLKMDGESPVEDKDIPPNYNWLKSVITSETGFYSICFTVNIAPGFEPKDQPIDFDHRSNAPFPRPPNKKRPATIKPKYNQPTELFEYKV